MFVGKVIGTVWSTVKWPQLSGHKLLLVRPYHLSELVEHSAKNSAEKAPEKVSGPDPKREAVVCVDLLDAGVGDDVVVAFGHAARVAAERAEGQTPTSTATSTPTATPTTTPIDAAVVAIVDVNGFSLSDHLAP